MSKKWLFRIVIVVVFIWMSFAAFDLSFIIEQTKELISSPVILSVMTLLYLLAFVLRAKAWQLYLGNEIEWRQTIHAVLYSLWINHLLPVKAGDAVRVGYVSRNQKIGWKDALQSVIVLRMLDLLVIGIFMLIGIFYVGMSLSFRWLVVLLGLLASGTLVIFCIKRWRSFLLQQLKAVSNILWTLNGAVIFLLVTVSWVCEAFVLFFVTKSMDSPLPFLEALWVNSFTIAGQVFHFTPGGVGTYESFMSAALTAGGMPLQQAYTIAILTHGFKFVFSFAVGLYLLLFAPVSWGSIKKWAWRKGEKR